MKSRLETIRSGFFICFRDGFENRMKVLLLPAFVFFHFGMIMAFVGFLMRFFIFVLRMILVFPVFVRMFF
ncbi:hypothetical protein LEP1GSC187_1906 [Leptospira santarosai str. ZUN179]|uniref:Uncharacterized protein n=1 Tax=Leptospira santarosai str. ZUN179 TaxID=1049985 RepID=M6URY3_9LEPT|nr:hypothetical protein LEP1GSC187_1906 [Leptospira santarosai str. ZUN179]